MQKVFVQQDKMARVTCPDCTTSKTVNVEKLKGSTGRLKLRCQCGSVFSVFFEFRRTHRKETHLDGYYAKLPANEMGSRIVVENVSRTGIGFTTLTNHDLSEGDNVKVTFILDDKRRSRIEKSAVVKAVKDRYIGCEFTNLTQDQKSLGFYLMS